MRPSTVSSGTEPQSPHNGGMPDRRHFPTGQPIPNDGPGFDLKANAGAWLNVDN